VSKSVDAVHRFEAKIELEFTQAANMKNIISACVEAGVKGRSRQGLLLLVLLTPFGKTAEWAILRAFVYCRYHFQQGQGAWAFIHCREALESNDLSSKIGVIDFEPGSPPMRSTRSAFLVGPPFAVCGSRGGQCVADDLLKLVKRQCCFVCVDGQRVSTAVADDPAEEALSGPWNQGL